MARLAKKFDVIAPEHPGFGASDMPAWLDTIADLANYYLEFLDELDLQTFYLFHAIRADLLRRLGRRDEAADAYERAIARSENTKERELLLERRRTLDMG